MANNYGEGVSRVLDPSFTQFLSVIWQAGLPPLDSEWNLVGDLSALSGQQQVLRGIPSGWLGNSTNSSQVYVTSLNWSNWFQFGRQRATDTQSIMWANINGWLVPVTGTQTGDPPGSPDDTDTWNKILLDPPPGSAGDARADFVFLEVWKARIAPYPSTLNKPNGSAIYKYGNVEGGFSYLPDDLLDPAIGDETTERVQLQYRIRVVKGLINLSTNPDGFDPTVVKAQGAQSTPPSVGGYTFTNMRETLGDQGLWRAGDGTQNVLGTVDGYVYAIPIAIVFRRNSILWNGDPAPNLNGAFNRNPLAVDRTGTLTFSTVPTLASAITATSSSISIVSANGIPLPVSPTPAAAIQIGDELLTYTTITGTTISGLTRGANGTVAEAHPIGSVISLISSRPDGLFSDQVSGTDILDLRHVVSLSGFDYQSLLQSNLDRLLRGQLRSTYKRSGADPRGSYVFYEDKISATAPAILGITLLDGPDNIRLAFSDAALQQQVELICNPTSGGSYPISTQTSLPPVADWDLELSANTTYQLASAIWSAGDQVQVPVNQFQTPSLPGYDADQVRILNEVPIPLTTTGFSYGTTQFTDTTVNFVESLVYPGDTIVIFTPLTGAPLGGSYSITEVTSTVLTSSVVIPAPVTPGPVNYEIRRGVGSVQVRIEGNAAALPQHRIEVTPANPGPTDDLVIQLVGTDGIIPTSSSTSVSSQLNITLNVQYGGGRGLSKRPDSLHNISLVNPTSEILVPPSNTIKPAWAVLWSKFRNDPYKGLLPVTAGAFADLGSKTIVTCPFRSIKFPQALYLPASALPLHAIMAQAPEGPSVGATDPLGLFHNNQYVTLPRHLVPSFGAVNSQILPPSSSGNIGSFGQGINFGLFSKVGSNDNSTYINYTLTVTCAVFSTHNLTTLIPATYNAALVYGFTYAGSRFFNDDPTAVGALTTARGLGRQGIECPPYYGLARVFGVYEAADYAVNGSAFNIASDRSPRVGGAKNLLRQNFDGPTFWIERDANGVSTFILNADIIDLTKSTVNPIASFAAGKYVIEANVFGFDVGAFDLTQQFRLAISSAVTLTGAPVPGPVAVLPGPLNLGNTALVNYSHVPYQGDPWQTQSSGLDSGYTRGPLDSPTAFQLASTSLNAAALTRPNQKSLEVLASMGFITSLGTGRLSGDFVTPNTYDPRNVGYEDPVDQSGVRPYPPTVASGGASTPRPITKLGAIGGSPIFTDLEANPEYLGLTTRLPLGALYRDKDFHGGRFSDQQSSPLIYVDKVGVGSGVAGLAVTETLDQLESPTMPAETSAGVAGDVLVMVDGESVTYSSLVNFRTNRGGSAFIGSGDHPGGELFATYEKVMGSVSGSRTVVGRAFLVRNAPTDVGATEVSAGDELMLAIVTQVMELNTTPSEAMVLLGTNGSGEGLSAADLYRIEGHPLIANHTFYDVDPTTISLPVGKTIAQISAPPDVPVIPLGAANTVYASNGLTNFWTNDPTLTNLSLLLDLDVGGDLTLTGSEYIAGNLVFTSLFGTITTPTAASGTTNAVRLLTGNGTGTANSGIITIVPGTVSGTGNAGNVQLEGGQASSGNGGQVLISGGNTSNGSGGKLTILGGGSVVSGTGGDILVLSGLSSTGTSAVYLGINTGPSSEVCALATITNADLILGPQSVGDYGINFTGTTTNPTIGQTTGTGTGATLTVRAQDAGPGNNDGGYVHITGGVGTGSNNGGGVVITSNSSTGSGSTGEVSIVNGTRTNMRVTAVDSESVFFGHNLVELGDGNTFDDFSLTFSSRVTNPKFGHKPTNVTQNLIVKAADISSIWTGNGGNLQLEAGNGLGSTFNGGNVVLLPGTPGLGGNQGLILFEGSSVAFDAAVSGPSNSGVQIGQLDQTGSHSGYDLLIYAQNQTAGSGGWGAGTLSLQAGSSTNGAGGDVEISSGFTGALSGAGGAIYLITGQSTTSEFGPVAIKPGGYEKALVDINGFRLTNPRLTDDNSIAFAKSANDPPTIPSGTTAVLYTAHSSVDNVLKYSTGVNDVRWIEGTVARFTNSTDTSTSNPINTDPVPITSFTALSVLPGDVVEGVANLYVSSNATGFTTTYGYITVRLSDGVAVTDFTTTWVLGTDVNQMVTIPLYYRSEASAPMAVTLIAGVSGGHSAALIISNAFSSPLPWLILKQLRGYPT